MHDVTAKNIDTWKELDVRKQLCQGVPIAGVYELGRLNAP
jgi:hypothetical protein